MCVAHVAGDVSLTLGSIKDGLYLHVACSRNPALNILYISNGDVGGVGRWLSYTFICFFGSRLLLLLS